MGGPLDPRTDDDAEVTARDLTALLLYSHVVMPKMKTHSGAKKRFKITANGKVKGRHSFTSHILEKKSAKRKRRLGQPAAISEHDYKQIKTLLGAKRK
jgi:large subunit ribosomal protein L35